jgi:subtilisin family serine protease
LIHRRQAFKEWKADFEDVYKHFIGEKLPDSAIPVKVAVLDTGIDLYNSCIEAHADRITGHNWLKEPKLKKLKDLHGHGTHIAGLILDWIPHSELYVAKVTDGRDTTCSPQTLAKVRTLKVGNEP